jgi:ferrous iron transport protein B
MHKIGLHGKSFIPMLLGFGCSVPGIMATRTIESKQDRITTMLVLPLMSCGARLPIYALLIPAFFPVPVQGPILWVIYFTGVLLAILSAKLLKKTILKGEASPFIMELPPYRVPTVKGILIHTWERGREYVKKAGTIILGFSILLWAMTTFPRKQEFSTEYDRLVQAAENRGAMEEAARLSRLKASEEIAYTVSGRAGRLIEPLLKPMGFDWKIGTATIGALAAKEIFVAQLGIVFSVGDAEENAGALRSRLQEEYTPLVAFCIMLFMLISTPCVATTAVTKKESGSWKWALFQLAGLTAMAYIITTIVYQLGMLFKVGV